MALTLSRTSDHSPPHAARSFARPPEAAEAAALLGRLASAPCRFAPVATDRPLALYGAGNLGRMARDFLQTVRREIALVIDRNAARLTDDPDWAGLPLVHPADVDEGFKHEVCVAVSVATSPYVPLERELFDLGFGHVVPFYDLAEGFRHLHPLSNGWFALPLTVHDREATETVLSCWSDDVSRAHHLQFLAWRRLREEWSFEAAPVSERDRFFIPEVAGVLRADEVLLDAGAHHGGVVQRFIAQTKGAFRQAIAVEPDPSNRAVLEDRLRCSLPGDPRLTIFDCALGERAGDATFHDGLGYASQLSDTGRMRVPVRPIDALGLAPSFVKLHLEGAELSALKGARQTLLTHRPIVAATVYHNADGIWRTPLWLMETLRDYRFLFRAHSWCGTGAVVYAIPNERAAP